MILSRMADSPSGYLYAVFLSHEALKNSVPLCLCGEHVFKVFSDALSWITLDS